MKEDREKLQPNRIKFAIKEITKKGYNVIQVNDTEINFIYKKNLIKIFPYTGWFTGKGITDGRGIYNLLKQI